MSSKLKDELRLWLVQWLFELIIWIAPMRREEGKIAVRAVHEWAHNSLEYRGVNHGKENNI